MPLSEPSPAPTHQPVSLDGTLPAIPVDNSISETVAAGQGLELISAGVEGLLAASLFIAQFRKMLGWIYSQKAGEPALPG